MYLRREMNAHRALPRNPRDVVRLQPRDALVYAGLIMFFKATGLWRYPQRMSGDLATMHLMDKVYWVYKAANPVRRAVRNSQLEHFFGGPWSLGYTPRHDFAPTARVTLSAAGDLMSHPFLGNSGASLYREAADLVLGADVSMANLEGVVQENAVRLQIDPRTGPPLVLPRKSFDIVTTYGERRYEFLATACNHSLDFGEPGVANTLAALKKAGIATNGVNETDDDAERPCIIEKRGISLGIAAYTFGLNAYVPPVHRPRIVNHLPLNRSVEDIDFAPLEAHIRYCGRHGVDFVIAHLHWGMEFELFPRPEQLAVAHRIAELGVDCIIGHHPHVLQPVEYYRTLRDANRIVPIYYSLGNLVNPFSDHWLCRSGVARVDLVKGVCADGTPKTYVERADLVEIDQAMDRVGETLTLRAVVG